MNLCKNGPSCAPISLLTFIPELTSANESLLMDNLPVFEKNGFKFSVDEEAPPSQRFLFFIVPFLFKYCPEEQFFK